MPNDRAPTIIAEQLERLRNRFRLPVRRLKTSRYDQIAKLESLVWQLPLEEHVLWVYMIMNACQIPKSANHGIGS